MLTVKLIDELGQEEIFEAECASLVRREDAVTSELMEFRATHGGAQTIVSRGDIYIMNGNGATVADYHFGAAPKTMEVSHM